MGARGLYLPNGQFLDFAETDRTALLSEIATRQAVGESWLAGLGTLPDPDPVLRKRGELAWVLDELTADDMVCTAIQTRKLKTLEQNDYRFTPGAAEGQKPTAQAQALCDNLVADLERLDLYMLMSEILDAPYHGLVPIELNWAATGGRIRLTGAQAKPRRWFGFDEDGELAFLGNTGMPQPVPFGKFLLARHFPSYDNPYGLRLLSRCLWPVAFKKGGIQFWSTFCDKFGQPWVVGKARQGAPAGERRDMLSALSAMVQDAVAVVSGGSEVQIIEPSGKSGDLHQAYVDHWDAAIARVLMGQTLTATEGQQHGTHALGKTHMEVLDAYAAADERLLATAMNELAWTYARVNAPEAVLAPVFSFVEPEDYSALADLDIKIKGLGVEFTPEYIARAYNRPPDEFRMTPTPPPPVSEPGRASFSAPPAADDPGFTPDQQSLENLMAAVLPEAHSTSDDLVARIADIIRRAETWDDLAILLAEELAAPGTDRFEELLQQAVLAADLWGRFTVRQGDGGVQSGVAP